MEKCGLCTSVPSSRQQSRPRCVGEARGLLWGSRVHTRVCAPRPGASPHLRLTVVVLPLRRRGVSVLVGLHVPTLQYVSLSLPVPRSLQGLGQGVPRCPHSCSLVSGWHIQRLEGLLPVIWMLCPHHAKP